MIPSLTAVTILSVLLFQHPNTKGTSRYSSIIHVTQQESTSSPRSEVKTLDVTLNVRRSIIIKDHKKSLANVVIQYLPADKLIFCWKIL